MKKRHAWIIFVTFILMSLSLADLVAEIKFDAVSMNSRNEFIFNSVEIIAGKQHNKTLFYGYPDGKSFSFRALSFYPEHLSYSSGKNLLFIRNRIGLYMYDLANKKIKTVKNYPNYAFKDEYTIYRLAEAGISPNSRYGLAKVATSSVKASIYLYDFTTDKEYEIIKDVDLKPGVSAGLWSIDSNFFVYEKDNSLYYFSVEDYINGKLLAEEWRFIGKGSLASIAWTSDNYLVWLENNLIYKADPRQFFSRAIYKNYIRQGKVIGKIPFRFEPSFDRFEFNDISNTFIIVKNHTSIFYYSMNSKVFDNPYLQLQENMRVNECYLYNEGHGIITVDEITNGDIIKSIYLLKHENNRFIFKKFDHKEIANSKIYNTSTHNDTGQFTINASSGIFCFDFKTEELLWKNTSHGPILNAIHINDEEWIINTRYIALRYHTKTGLETPLFAISFEKTGFIDDKIGVICHGKKYYINKDTNLLENADYDEYSIDTNTKTEKYRLLSREINKGFYSEGVYLKELYTGKFIAVTGEPLLRYKLYQPEIKLGLSYYLSPSTTKYEIALVFDCVKTDEGIFPILNTLNQFEITATFFMSGNFMEINPDITREVVNFDVEVGNLFQYHINLTDSGFLIDQNFIRQGLSANEETYFDLTGKNFSPIWHTPSYIYNDKIITFGNESGYKFITYNLDSLDWVNISGSAISATLYKNNSELTERLLRKVKPGQIVIFSAGKNDSDRKEWLFNDLDVLISELIRAGYSFTTVTDLLKKYRE